MPIKNIAEEVLLGSVNVLWNSVNQGHIDRDGIEIDIVPEVVESQVGDFGNTPVNAWDDGLTIEGTFKLVQTADFDVPLLAIGDAQGTKVTTGVNSAIGVGNTVGSPMTTNELKFLPIVAANTPTYDLTIHRAMIMGSPKLLFKTTEKQVWEIKFKGLIDENRVSGDQLFKFGDTTIAADVTAPLVSSTVPADAAAAVAVGDDIVITMGEAINPDTVTDKTVSIFETPVGSGPTALKVAKALTVSADGLTITINPTANLSAATVYMVALDGIKDPSGNELIFYVWEFTTA